MTGYARVVSARSGVNLTWFLKSLNGRSRDILLRTPPIFDQFVNRFRSVLSSHPVRGRLEAELQTCPAGMEDSGTEINWLRIAEIRSWIETIRQNWDLGMSVDPLALLQWPGVLVRKEPDVSLE
ncbi:protein containing YicC-like protein, partial [mine drainage metagenome]